MNMSMLEVYSPTPVIDINLIIDDYMENCPRLILLDYDGTLTPIRKTPSAAVPAPEVLRALRLLTIDVRNYVYIVSGRDQSTLENWLGRVPRLGLR